MPQGHAGDPESLLHLMKGTSAGFDPVRVEPDTANVLDPIQTLHIQRNLTCLDRLDENHLKLSPVKSNIGGLTTDFIEHYC